MKIRLLVATSDSDYAEHLSGVLSEKHADTFDISVCSSAERFRDLLAVSRYDAALVEPHFVSAANISAIQLPLLLIDETGGASSHTDIRGIRKYQKISSIVGEILELFSEIDAGAGSFGASRARITAVWSPAGGSGKTTVALAYAAHQVAEGKQIVYLNLENFSSATAYFAENGKSISKAFEKLESNVHMFLTGIRQMDGGSGISYFSGPENYDDMNILSANDLETLINACVIEMDELVIDLSSQCDARVQKILNMADMVLLVCDATSTSQIKMRQFLNQHNVFGQINAKTVLVSNKGAKNYGTGIRKEIQLPYIQSADPVSVFKALSGANFDW